MAVNRYLPTLPAPASLRHLLANAVAAKAAFPATVNAQHVHDACFHVLVHKRSDENCVMEGTELELTLYFRLYGAQQWVNKYAPLSNRSSTRTHSVQCTLT